MSAPPNQISATYKDKNTLLSTDISINNDDIFKNISNISDNIFIELIKKYVDVCKYCEPIILIDASQQLIVNRLDENAESNILTTASDVAFFDIDWENLINTLTKFTFNIDIL